MSRRGDIDRHLVLRPYGTPNSCRMECLPRTLAPGKTYHFMVRGKKDFSKYEDVRLEQKTPNKPGNPSPVAKVRIIGSKQFKAGSQPWTCGRYVVQDAHFHFSRRYNTN